MVTFTPAPSLEEFLKLPETKPASEYINGEIIQKPMPKGKHSRLQLRLCNSINENTESQKIAYALPKLRCTFGNRSIIPDIAVFKWSRIPFDADGEIPNDFLLSPDWTTEIALGVGWLLSSLIASIRILRMGRFPGLGD